jgi:hypothetical protein
VAVVTAGEGPAGEPVQVAAGSFDGAAVLVAVGGGGEVLGGDRLVLAAEPREGVERVSPGDRAGVVVELDVERADGFGGGFQVS